MPFFFSERGSTTRSNVKGMNAQKNSAVINVVALLRLMGPRFAAEALATFDC